MKIKYTIILVFIFSVLISCKSTDKTNAYTKDLSFDWKIAGKIPSKNSGEQASGLAGPVTGISDNKLIIGGGSNFPDAAPWDGGDKKYYDKVYIFKKEKDSLILESEYFTLPYKIGYSANTTTAKGIVVAGGENDSGTLNKVFLLNWNNKNKLLKNNSLPNLPQPLSSASITSIKDDIYLAGGQNDKRVSNKLYHLDLNNLEKGWNRLPDIAKKISHAVLYGINSKTPELYLVGGRKRNKDSVSDLYSSIYRFDIKGKRWTKEAELPYALSAHTGVSWGEQKLLVFGGDQGETFRNTEKLIAEINQENDKSRKEKLIVKKDELQKDHPGFDGNVLAYDLSNHKWKKIDSIPFKGQVTTDALKWNGTIIIPNGEIRAGVRTPIIILGKLKKE